MNVSVNAKWKLGRARLMVTEVTMPAEAVWTALLVMRDLVAFVNIFSKGWPATAFFGVAAPGITFGGRDGFPSSQVPRHCGCGGACP